MSNELESIIMDIKHNQKIADTPVPEHPQTYRVRLGNQKRAKENLISLKKDYMAALLSRVALIVAGGKGSAEFAKLAKEEFDCFAISATSFFEDMAADIHPQLYTDTTATSHIFHALEQNYIDRSHDFDIASAPGLTFTKEFKRVLKDKADLVKLAQDAFMANVGGEIVGLDAIEKVSTLAIAEEYVAGTVPIILHTNDVVLAGKLTVDLNRMFRNTFSIENLEGDIDEALVEQTLKDIRQKIK